MTFFNSRISNIKLLRTDPSSQLSTSNWQYLSGSRITYTPTKDSSFISYQFTFSWHRSTTSSNLMHLKLVSGSNELAINNSPQDITNINFNVGSSSDYSRSTTTVKRIIPAWEGEKVIQLNFRHYTNSFKTEVNELDRWAGGTVENDTNSNLVVYSIK